MTGLGNALEAFLGVVLLRSLMGSNGLLDRARDVFAFMAIALAVCLANCTIESTSLCIAGVAPWSVFGTMWLTWWLGNAVGLLIVTPVVLGWSRRERMAWPSAKGVEVAILFVLLVAAGEVLFGGWLAPGAVKSLPYFMLPFLLWAAFRFGQREAVTAVALESGFAIWSTVRWRGPFAGDSLNESLLLVQAFVGVMAITSLVLAASVAERRQAEIDLARHADELHRSNLELEQFAYVASHDLKAPLRGISSLATWIAKDYSGVLAGEGLENLQLLVGRAQRMNNLIKGILKYSRAGRAASVPESIDSQVTTFALIESLPPPPGVDVSVEGRLPTVVYDRTHLEQVLQNLIDNAIKHLGKPSGSVVISARNAADVWEFCVRDNGVGIPERHFERIFGLFQTLKPKDELESTGIGLSLVKRIVERHGGTVRVRSKVGERSDLVHDSKVDASL